MRYAVCVFVLFFARGFTIAEEPGLEVEPKAEKRESSEVSEAVCYCPCSCEADQARHDLPLVLDISTADPLSGKWQLSFSPEDVEIITMPTRDEFENALRVVRKFLRNRSSVTIHELIVATAICERFTRIFGTDITTATRVYVPNPVKLSLDYRKWRAQGKQHEGREVRAAQEE